VREQQRCLKAPAASTWWQCRCPLSRLLTDSAGELWRFEAAIISWCTVADLHLESTSANGSLPVANAWGQVLVALAALWP